MAVVRDGLSGITSRVRPVEEWYQALQKELSEARKYRRPTAILSGSNAQRLVASGGGQTLSLTAPEVVAANAVGAWAVDIQVELESHSQARPESAWWFLPRRNSRSLVHEIFGAAARVNCDSLFSVKIRQDPGLVTRAIRPELKLSLPAESIVVPYLLLKPLELGFTLTEGRIEQVRKAPPISAARISSEGAKLRGLIDLFGTFWTAREYCERKFWREGQGRRLYEGHLSRGPLSPLRAHLPASGGERELRVMLRSLPVPPKCFAPRAPL